MFSISFWLSYLYMFSVVHNMTLSFGGESMIFKVQMFDDYRNVYKSKLVIRFILKNTFHSFWPMQGYMRAKKKQCDEKRCLLALTR
jgi:hypothetical protein